jgi:hypothetical protein
MEQVPQRQIVQYWLEREVEKAPGERVDPSALSTERAVDALLRYKPGAADVVWRDQPIRWYRLDLPRARFEKLRLIGGPPGLLWHALSPEGTVLGAARRILDEPAEELEAETGVDVGAIDGYRERIAAGEDVGSLIVATRTGCVPWYVADGNHRATARACHLLDTGAYEPQPAYLAVGANPVLRPLYERVCGVLRRARRLLP